MANVMKDCFLDFGQFIQSLVVLYFKAFSSFSRKDFTNLCKDSGDDLFDKGDTTLKNFAIQGFQKNFSHSLENLNLID